MISATARAWALVVVDRSPTSCPSKLRLSEALKVAKRTGSGRAWAPAGTATASPSKIRQLAAAMTDLCMASSSDCGQVRDPNRAAEPTLSASLSTTLPRYSPGTYAVRRTCTRASSGRLNARGHRSLRSASHRHPSDVQGRVEAAWSRWSSVWWSSPVASLVRSGKWLIRSAGVRVGAGRAGLKCRPAVPSRARVHACDCVLAEPA